MEVYVETQKWARLNVQAQVIKALAHPTRLFIVQELEQGERCVCQLTELIDVDTSTVSRHLAILRTAGIIVDEKRGNQVFYSLKVPCVLNFLDCVEAVLETNAREQLSLQNSRY
jgi:DNA-binding transcriptional ArsR family regulator